MESILPTVNSLIQSAFPFEWARYDFVWRAIGAMLIISPLCAALGVHVVNFRMAFFSDAISHSTFAGVALGILLSLDPMITLIGFGILAGLNITLIKGRSELSADTVISVILSATVALGLTILYAQKEARNLETYLFGSVLAISLGELTGLLIMGVAVFFLMAFFFNRLLLISLNRQLAASRGIPLVLLEYGFSVVLAIVVTFSIRIIGLFLITAMLVVPAAIARNLARDLSGLFWLTMACSCAAGISGVILSFYLDAPVGATTILIGSVLFLFSWLRLRWK